MTKNKITLASSERIIVRTASYIQSGAILKILTAVAIGLIVGGLFIAFVPIVSTVFAAQPLGDFTVTFYRAANYLLRGENVYFNRYPNPLNGREYPPYNPVWILYAAVPLGVFPLHVAETMRLMLDLAGITYLAYLAKRWAKLERGGYAVLLALAPWHTNMIFDGTWGVPAFVGTMLCYWGLRRVSVSLTSIGLWLLLVKPNVGALVILATLLLTWRNGIFTKTVGVLIAFTAVSILFNPSWIFDLKDLYLERLAHPRLEDSVLLLPGYPWAQLGLLSLSSLFVAIYFWRDQVQTPTPYLWAVLASISLVSALHTFIYDWIVLMLPLALIMRERWGVVVAIALYIYPVLWSIALVVADFKLPQPTLVPSLVLVTLLISRIRFRKESRFESEKSREGFGEEQPNVGS